MPLLHARFFAIAFSTLRSKVIERTRLNANRVIAKAVLMRFI